MKCCGPNMNANSGNYNYYSRNAKVSFDGFINENYFLLERQEKNLVQNISFTHAITKNPITYKKEAFIGLFLNSKYDGIGNRHPLDISIALDVSGSMSIDDDDENNGKSRITLAKESLKKLISIMDQEKDRMSLITFNHETKKIFGLLDKNEIERKFLNDLDSINANGGTDLLEALKGAINNMNENGENINIKKDKRIIMITDVDYFDSNDNLFNLFKTCVEEKGISITIIAISSNSNLSLADKISHFKGCNYFSITKSSELETYLVKQFNYIFFPIAHETKLTIKSENSQIIKCVGGDNEITDELENNDNNDAINSNSKEVSFNLGSAFSSELINIKDNEGNDKLYINGGLILLKINPDDLNKNEDLKFDFILEYTSFDGNKCCQNYSYSIENKKEEKNNFFKDNNIRKGISIYYFCVILNHIVEIENKGNYEYLDNEKDESQKQRDMKLLETRQAVSDYLKDNFILDPKIQETTDNLSNYLKLIEERYSGFKDVIYKFYNYSVDAKFVTNI